MNCPAAFQRTSCGLGNCRRGRRKLRLRHWLHVVQWRRKVHLAISLRGRVRGAGERAPVRACLDDGDGPGGLSLHDVDEVALVVVVDEDGVASGEAGVAAQRRLQPAWGARASAARARNPLVSPRTHTALGLLMSRKSLLCGRSLTNEPFGSDALLNFTMSPSCSSRFCIICAQPTVSHVARVAEAQQTRPVRQVDNALVRHELHHAAV